LYKKITDNADQVLDKLNNNNESFNTLKSSSDSKRSGRKHRSADNTYMEQDADKKTLMADMKNDNSSSYPQQVNNDSSESRGARNIIKEIESYKEECTRIRQDLAKIKATLDKIKRLLNTAKSYLNETRKVLGSNQVSITLLSKLDQAIGKVNSSHASLIICYEDAFSSLEIADTAFGNAHSWAEKALKEASKEYNNMEYNDHYYASINAAKNAMKNAKIMLETAKQKQEYLKNNMLQANAELEKLNKAYEAALQATES
ncbi:immunogenic protein P37, partial [Borrelia sp. A-FGy1]|uniref:immunogenic protein P37 n=1 Tax=Borrelia sp. A-FGy1 TaxID=2608247 RepID=UPI0015F498C5